jgi:nitrite reductase/ring-hydroxylating ferredoxin subunit
MAASIASTLELRVSNVTSLEQGASRTFHFQRDGIAEEGFVLRLGTGCVAYLNRCPHWHVDLDLGDGRFYDDELDRIYCKNHGALFLALTGECDSGPCFGDSLERFDVVIDGADAVVTVPNAEPLPIR